MTENERHDERTAGHSEREASPGKAVLGQRYLDRAEQDAQYHGKSENAESEFVKLKALFLFGLCAVFVFFALGYADGIALTRHVCMCDLGDYLNEQHNTDNSEWVCDSMTQRHKSLLGCDLLCRGKRGGGGQRTGKHAVGEVRADAGYQCEHNGKSRADKDDYSTERNIRFCVLFQIAEEVRSGNISDGGDKEYKTHVFKELVVGDSRRFCAFDIEI